MTAIEQTRPEAWHIAPAVHAVARRAHYVASLVAYTLDAIHDQAGIDVETARSRPFPVGFLLELGAVMQLALWENAGLTFHPEAGLPSADAAGKDLERRAKLGPSEFEDATRLDLWRRVNAFWTEHCAWDAQHLLGAEVAVDHTDDDLLVERLANFLWTNRRVLAAERQFEET